MEKSKCNNNGLIRMVIINLINRFSTGNNIAAILLGAAIVIAKSIFYMKYSVGHTVNIFESYILNFSSNRHIIFVIVPTLLLFIDAPFIDDYTFVSVYRIKRKKWFYSNYLYIVLRALLYNIFLLLASMIPLVSVGYIENRWSQTFLCMMYGYNDRIDKYNLAVPLKELADLSPLKTVVLTVILFSLYIVFFAEVIFSINMLCKRKYLGTIMACLIYLLTTLIDGQAFRSSDIVKKYSLIRNAILPLGYCPELSDYKFSILYMILLNYIVYIFASTLYPFADFEESNNEN